MEGKKFLRLWGMMAERSTSRESRNYLLGFPQAIQAHCKLIADFQAFQVRAKQEKDILVT